MMPNIDWSSVAVGVGMTAAAHPFTYVKVLVQLGHEPLPPTMRRNMFFRKQLQYPGVFHYIKHIRETDGLLGLFQGLTPRICANLTTSLTYAMVGHKVDLDTSPMIEPELKERPAIPPCDDPEELRKVCIHTSKETIARCSAVILSHPFHVIAIRTMAQFIGREQRYTSLWGSVKEIQKEDGILGFFAGLMPRLACELLTVWLCNLLTHTLNHYVISDRGDFRDLRQYSQMATSYIAQSVTYPLSVTSTIMACNGTSLDAGHQPFIPVYRHWWQCFEDLHARGAAHRGSSMLFRKVIVVCQAATSVSPIPSTSLRY